MLKELQHNLYKNIIKFLFLCAVITCNPFLHSGEQYYDSNSNITLISNTQSIQPNGKLIVGIKFELEEGWHTYWKNPGDAGEGASIEWDLSKGLTASKVLWPGPERIPVEPLMTFGYNDEVILLTEISSDENVQFPLNIQAQVGWFTCKEICIPQEGIVELKITSGNFIPSKNNEEINNYLESVPTRFNQEYRVEKLDDKYFLLTDIDNGKHFEDIYFFPNEYGLTSYNEDQIYEKNLNSFTLEIKASKAKLNLDRFEGVIETLNSDEKNYYEISFPLQNKVKDDSQNVVLLILFAFIGGLILNIMPCVFPILSIKILRFVEYGENSSSQTYKFGLFYSLGVILSFLLIAFTLLAFKSSGEVIGWGFQLQYPLVIAILFYLFVALGFMFMSNLVFGSQLGQLSVAAQVKNESLESFLTGILAVVVASPCTAPFMGSAIGFALLQPSLNSIFIFLSLGIGFALPYLILSIKPALLSFLPKPGAWMETFKQFMAFPMWASALWLLWVLSGQVDPDTVILVLIGGLSISLALWLLERNTSEIMLLKWLVRLAVLAIFALSILILPTSYSTQTSQNQQDITYSEELLTEYRDDNELIFLNFTADWCITCKVNESVALNSEEVKALINQKNIRYLEADWTRKNEAIAKKLEEFGRSGVPLYLLYPSTGKPIILPEILTEDILLNYLNELG
jgi:thiol:disulfide interchange protein DsbD